MLCKAWVTQRIPLLIIFPRPSRNKIFERISQIFLPYPKCSEFETGEGCTHWCKVPASWAAPKLIQHLKKRFSLFGGQAQQQWVSPQTHTFTLLSSDRHRPVHLHLNYFFRRVSTSFFFAYGKTYENIQWRKGLNKSKVLLKIDL